MIIGKYVNLFTDFGFKKVLGEEANKDILIDFLNQVLPENYIIKDLQFSKNEHLGQTEENRKAIFDLYCISSKGEYFIVELQKARQDFFKDRSIYYASFPIQEMAKKGKIEGVEWDYQLDPIFTIGILNFAFKDSVQDKDKLYHHVQLKDQDCQVFYDKLHFIYLELAKFTKPLSACENHYERWLWVFKNLPKQEEIPADLQVTIFKKLFDIAEVAKLNPEEQIAYKESLKHLWDMKNVVNTAYKEGETIGLEKGEAIRIAKGENKGVALALKILQLYNQKKSIQEIAQIVGKPEDFVRNVVASFN